MLEIGKLYKFNEPIRLSTVGDSNRKFVDLFEDDIILVFDIGREYHISKAAFCLLSFIFEDRCYSCVINPEWAEDLELVGE